MNEKKCKEENCTFCQTNPKSKKSTKPHFLSKDLTTNQTIKKINESPDLTSARQTLPILYIKGIGKFCECGCGRPILPIKIKGTSPKGKKYYYVMRKSDQRWASPACRQKYRRMMNLNKDNSIRCRINLNVVATKTPYRKLTLYFGKGQFFEYHITNKSKDLWDYLERIAKYRSLQIPPLITK